jgi:hypothetical protein
MWQDVVILIPEIVADATKIIKYTVRCSDEVTATSFSTALESAVAKVASG